MADIDEEIRIRISVEDQEATSNLQNLRQRMETFKAFARDLAKETGDTLSVAFSSFQKTGLQNLDNQIAEIQKELNKLKSATVLDQDAIDESINKINVLKQAQKDLNEVASKSLTESREEARKFSQVLSNLGRAQRASIESSTKAQRDWEKATKQGLSQMSAGAQAYGTSVGRVAKIIQSTSQRTGQSFQQVANRMTQLGVPINLVNSAMKQLNMTVNQVANNIKKVAQNTGQSFTQAAQRLQSFGVPINTINAALQQLSTSSQQVASNLGGGLGGIGGKIGGFISNLGNLGNIGKYVFGSVLGITAITALRDLGRAFVNLAKDIVQRGSEMTEVMFTFQVAIRGLQRTGLDTTISEWTSEIQKLKNEFPFFPKREFIEGISLAALMTREFGFTAEQITNVTRLSAILAQITGKDLNESVRGVTYAIGSGYFESLQRAGVNISRQIVANEALRQGYTGVYNELEQTVRAQITYNVIQQNLAAIQDDAALKTQTFAGQLQILNATIEDTKNLFGEVVTSSDSLIDALKTLNEALRSIYDIYEALSEFDIDIFAPFRAFTGLDNIISDVKEFITVLESLKDVLSDLAEVTRYASNLFGGFATVLGALGFEGVESSLRGLQEELFNTSRALEDLAATDKIEIDTTIGDVKFSEEDYKEIIDATEELGREIAEIEEEYAEKRQDIRDDYQKDVEKNALEHYRKLEDLAEDHQQKLDDIELKRGQKIADEIEDYNYRVEDAQRDAAQRREDAERKYRDRELREERKFQEKLRQLRENFLLDLEDAVRERDARQIIRLTRQYNLRREQMVREEKINKEDRKDAFQEELREIERQRQERLRQLAIEHQRRLQDIDLQAQRERDRAETDYERRKSDEQRRWNEQKAERNARLAEQLSDLDTWRDERIAKVIDGLREEYGLTEQQLNAIEGLWKSKFGPNGTIASAVSAGVDQTIAYMQRLAQYMNAFYTSLGMIGSVDDMSPLRKALQGGYDISGYDNAGGQAEGGTIIARKPTVAIFGEAGPEMATFTPLSGIGSTSPSKIMPDSLNQMSKEGLIRLEMLLSPDLEARVIDNTLSEIADVNFRIERARK